MGKTTIARELAPRIGAVHLRIDSIEDVLVALDEDVDDRGYRVAYAIAADTWLQESTSSPIV